MNKNPLEYSQNQLLELLSKYNFKPAQTMSSIILVGGMGTRLNDSRKKISTEKYPEMSSHFINEIGPKGMAMLTCETPRGKENKTLTDWHLDIHHSCNKISEYILALGCRSDIMKDYYKNKYNCNYRNIPITFLEEEKPAGTLAPAIKLLIKDKLPTHPVVYANGDNLIDINFYDCYLAGCLQALKLGINLDALVIDIVALVPWEESNQYGTVDLDFDSGLAKRFMEKAPIEQNVYKTINNKKMTPINSGFSIIVNPKYLYENFLDQNVIDTSLQLENGTLDYKENETIVKYETFYGKIAAQNNLIGVYLPTYWTDLGTEDKIILAENEFSKTSIVSEN